MLAQSAAAQTIGTDPVSCIPREANTIVNAVVEPEVKGSDSVRFYFRRVNPVGGFYWVEMQPSGGGAYWAVIPKAEDRKQEELFDEWWDILQHRDWMKAGNRDREWLAEFFESQEYESSEYYVAVLNAAGEEVKRSTMQLTEVKDRDDCVVGLDRHQFGLSQSLTVGETLESQQNEAVFHWLCDGIVSRVDFEDVLRPDELCRACVLAGLFPAATAAGAIVAATAVEKREPRRTSRIQP